ncbi:MAG TPA: hypothetical protein VF476_16325, partial [Chitinophagaceae bacterium]
MNEVDGLRHQAFNTRLQRELEELVFEIPKANKDLQKNKLSVQPSSFKKITLTIPALLGWLIHFPLFAPIKNFTWKRTYNNDHYDSVMMGILFLTYPFYLLLLTFLTIFFTKSWWSLSLLMLLPFTAWAYVKLKPQLDK